MRHSVVSRLSLAATAAIIVVGVTACSSGSGGAGPSTSTEQKKIAVLRNVPEGAFSVAEVAGLNSVFSSAGYTIDEYVANYDPGAQLSQCDTAISTGDYAGIIILPADTMAVTSCVTSAAEAGIPIVSLEQPVGPDIAARGLQTPQLNGQVVMNQPAYVERWADVVVDACATLNPCNLGLVRGEPQYPDDAIQRATWDQQVAEHPQLKIVAESVGGFSDPGRGISATQNILQTAPDVHVLVVSDDETAAGVATELERSGRTDVLIVGFGGVQSAIDRIAAGTQFGSVVLTPVSAGAAAAEMLLTAIRGEAIAETSVDWTQVSPLGPGNVTVTKANVDQFTPQY